MTTSGRRADSTAGAGAAGWHALDVERARSRLDTPDAGLDRREVERRRRLHGANRLPEPPRRPAWKRLAAQFHNVLIYALLGPALATGC